MRTKWLLTTLFAVAVNLAFAQENESTMKLSLEEAKEYALQYNKMVQASRMDVDAARMATWESISAGLPQVNGSASLNDNLKLMTQLLPGEFFGQPGTKIPVQFGSQFNASYGLQVTQLIFNASWLLGVQTAKVAESMTGMGLEKSELDIRESVTSTYYLILISEESRRILDENLANLKEVLKSTEAMYEVGMAEATDVDQMKSNISMIENSARSMDRNIEVSYNLMRFQLGLGTDATLELTQTLEDFLGEIDVNTLSMQDFSLQNHVDYRLLSEQEKISELSVKMKKAAVLPSLAGYYSYSESGMGDKLNDLQWFPNSMIGLQLSVPIFASGQRYTGIKKAEFELEKTRTNKSFVEDQLLMQEKQLKYNLINASEQFESHKNNVEVAKRVYTSVENKYRQGLASSLDLTQAHGNYLDAVGNYTNSLMTLLQTELALDKLMNNLQ